MCEIINTYCIDCFPELKEHFRSDQIDNAANLGAYILHEDFLLKWIIETEASDRKLKRIAEYIEYLANSLNPYMRDLAQIALLEGLINQGYIEIASHLKPKTRKLLTDVALTTTFDLGAWLNCD